MKTNLVKPGTILKVLGSYTTTREGDLIKVYRTDGKKIQTEQCAKKWPTWKGWFELNRHVKLATPEECIWYNRGVRNVRHMPEDISIYNIYYS